LSGTQNAAWYSPVFSLRWRLSLVYSALFVVFVLIFSIFLYSFTSDQLLHSAQDAFQKRAQALRSLLIQEICDQSSSQTLANFIRQNTGNDIDAIYLLDKTGKVIASSKAGQSGQSSQSSQKSQSPISGNSSNDLLLPVSAPAMCATPQRLPSYIRVRPSYASEQSTLNAILLLLGITSTIIVLVGILLISLSTGFMLKPLQQVTRATRELAQGNLQQRVPIQQSHDEIGALAESFNQMADQIEHMFAAQQASERRAQRFVSDASHELRTPITSLRGFTEVLIRGAKDDPATAQRVLGLMKNEAERMTKLVNDLLTLARLDEGHFTEAQGIDLVDLAVECLQQARKQAPKDHKLTLELATHERLTIHAGREPIQQMLLILLDNALKYGCTEEQRKVLLLLDKKAQHVLIEVIDYGTGITPNDLPHIFDRFYRGENVRSSTNTRIPGTGLGLPIAMAIAEAYQGSITAHSEPDHETVFTVSFPLS
jgi:two-component system, OmpR family, sensor kinase